MMDDFIQSALKNAPTREVQSNEDIKISVIGCGGGGTNTVQRLHNLGVKGAGLYALNTDKQHLNTLAAEIGKLLIGKSITRGLGAGGFPEVGQKCAEADIEAIKQTIGDSQLVFICAGMGGGTGTGAAPVVAKAAKEAGAIVVSFVTYPFKLERARVDKADEGIAKLREHSDSVIILDNNRLVELVPNLPMDQAFLVADEILAKAVGGLVFTITQPSLVNIDFADIRAIMTKGDLGMIAVGTGKGQNMVEDAAESVKHNKLVDVDFRGAKGAILHIAGGDDLTLGDAIRAGELITEELDPHASVKWGARLMPAVEGQIEVCAIITGVTSPYIQGRQQALEASKKKQTNYILSV